MLSSWLILASGLVLAIYWFRHNCRAILSSRWARDYASQVASANHLSFLEVQYGLEADGEPGRMHSLSQSLLRDYRILSYLLRHTGEAQWGPESFDARMLMLDFRLMQGWYSVTRKISRGQARRALEEMSGVLTHLANCMGQRTILNGSGVSRG